MEQIHKPYISHKDVIPSATLVIRNQFRCILQQNYWVERPSQIPKGSRGDYNNWHLVYLTGDGSNAAPASGVVRLKNKGEHMGP